LLDDKLAHQDSITLGELIHAELEPYGAEGPGRLTIEGETVRIVSPKAIALGLAVNELATNALKYGALSTPAGRLDVRWRQTDDRLILEWRESDGPAVRAHAMESFGSRLLHRLVEGQLKGSLRRELADSGVTCVMEVPLDTPAEAEPEVERASF
jgi:two-component sensor histidine kinase